MTSKSKKYDLEDRTASFGIKVIKFARKIPQDAITKPLISQLIRAATSIGANYCEADDAQSRRDFQHKICICKKECREVKHWLKMIVNAEPISATGAKELFQEAKEMNLIFNAIVNKLKLNA